MLPLLAWRLSSRTLIYSKLRISSTLKQERKNRPISNTIPILLILNQFEASCLADKSKISYSEITMDKRFAVVLLVMVAIIGGVFVLTRDKTKTTSSSTSGTSSHSSGAVSSEVELIEFGDFQCPACASFYPVVEQIRETYGDKIKFTFRNFPLVTIHRNALASHRSAEAAGIQGKFFEMYDLLYQNQTSWAQLTNPLPVFESYAKSLKLDMAKYKTDFNSEAVNDTINADIKEGKDKYGANSTPTFILNGQKLVNTEIGSLELLSKKIDAAIAGSSADL